MSRGTSEELETFVWKDIMKRGQKMDRTKLYQANLDSPRRELFARVSDFCGPSGLFRN